MGYTNRVCAVLMSTFNGENYIREQIDSIINQDNVEVDLYIRDDGSTDNTVSIIKSYENLSNVFYFGDSDKLGPGKSFLKLLFDVYSTKKSYQFYAFADQDDIWEPEKINSAISKMEEETPTLYCSNQYIYKNGIIEGVRFQEIPDLSVEGHILKNSLSGCTFVMNRSLVQAINAIGMPDDSITKHRLHDSWIFYVAVLIGDVIYDPEPHILYRIHSNNTVGLNINMGLMSKLSIIASGSKKHLAPKQATIILDNFKAQLKAKDTRLLSDIRDYYYYKPAKRRLIQNEEIWKNAGVSRFKYILKVLLNYL